ncbi:hypothetical protein D4R99_05245 [bacterium]|nr:MAG: hypothetical protein D4R99_05245 [bacterium]
MIKVRLIIEENKNLKSDAKASQRIDSLQELQLSARQRLLQDCESQIALKESQIRKLELTPHETITIDSRRWYEIPAVVIVSAVVGIAVGHFLIQK